MIVSFFWLFVGGVLLYGGAEWLVRSSVSLALAHRISGLVIGLTVVALGTSSPELAVSLRAALMGDGDIAVGNVIGSNICNIALILGLVALFRPIRIHVRLVKQDVPVLILLTLLFVVLLVDQTLSRLNGLFLVSLLIVYVATSLLIGRTSPEPITFSSLPGRIPKPILVLLIALAVLVLGAHLFLKGAVELATVFGVSQAVIGLSVVAVGTSLPELATSLVAAWRGEQDLAVGNAVGSNIINILAILGVSSLVHPITVIAIRPLDMIVLMGMTVILLPFLFTRFRLSRIEGVILLLAYGVYITVRYAG